MTEKVPLKLIWTCTAADEREPAWLVTAEADEPNGDVTDEVATTLLTDEVEAVLLTDEVEAVLLTDEADPNRDDVEEALLDEGMYTNCGAVGAVLSSRTAVPLNVPLIFSPTAP